MPRPGMLWRHVVISTHNSWLPGDPRGFRSKDHKIHSSGDYKAPPPEGEHAGLHEYSKRISGPPVVIPLALRAPIGRALLADLHKRDGRVLVVAVAGLHAHFLVELPEDLATVRQIVGRAKTAACHAMHARLPGKVWGRYGTYKPVKGVEHQRSAFYYILRQKDAWVWSFRDGMPSLE